MAKGDLVCIRQGTAMYDQPVSINDNVGGVRHYVGLAKKGQTCLILSDSDDWEATPFIDWSSSWSQVLLGGRVVWVKNHFLTHLVQSRDSVVY